MSSSRDFFLIRMMPTPLASLNYITRQASSGIPKFYICLPAVRGDIKYKLLNGRVTFLTLGPHVRPLVGRQAVERICGPLLPPSGVKNAKIQENMLVA